MPSPPLAPDDGPIDIEHLQRMTLGDAGLEREVLAMFSAQAVQPGRRARELARRRRSAGAYAEGFGPRDRRVWRRRGRRPSGNADQEWRRSVGGARRAQRRRGAGALGGRRDPAPVLIPGHLELFSSERSRAASSSSLFDEFNSRTGFAPDRVRGVPRSETLEAAKRTAGFRFHR